jgi:hypothetical protein
MKAKPWLMKVLKLERKAQRVEQGAKAVESGAKAADKIFAGVDDVWAGLRKGNSSNIRTVESPQELDRVYGQLTRGSQPTRWKRYSGEVMRRSDGIEVGIRRGSKSGGAAIDIRIPDQVTRKIHIR